MARIETATLEDLRVEHCNISDAVGVGEKNDKNDVMLIQAFFKILGAHKRTARERFRLTPQDMPEPTGLLNEITVRAIWAFQRTMAGRLLNIDGKIHPADYENRVIRNAFVGGRLMAITLINIETEDEQINLALKSLSETVKSVAPAIIFQPAQPAVP